MFSSGTFVSIQDVPTVQNYEGFCKVHVVTKAQAVLELNDETLITVPVTLPLKTVIANSTAEKKVETLLLT